MNISIAELKDILERQCYLAGEKQINLTSQTGRDLLINSVITEIEFLKDQKGN